MESAYIGLLYIQKAWCEHSHCGCWVENDLAVAPELLHEECPLFHPYAPKVMTINDLCSRDWEVCIIHVSREENRVVDFLVDFTYSIDLRLHYLSTRLKGYGDLLFHGLLEFCLVVP